MISELWIDEAVRDDATTKEICRRLGRLKAGVVSDASQLYEALARDDDAVTKGKRVLHLTRNRGSFIKKCPGTRHYLCCGYHILHIGTYCTMDCAYCILQAYFHPPVLQFFVNHKDMVEELTSASVSKTRPIRRIGTGEFTDSLIWEPWTRLSSTLVPLFGRQDRMALELKTKTHAVKNLGGLLHNRKTIVSWSLNTPRIIREQERGTAPLSARLEAASLCESWGYPLAFHFDPLFLYDGWEEDYRMVVERLFEAVSAENVVWISLGSFRFMPQLKPVIERRFPSSTIAYGEFVPGMDGKLRYFKPLRMALYRAVLNRIKDAAPDVPVYLCMEDERTWEEVFGFVPQEPGGLSKMLDESAVRHCGLK